MLQPDCTRLRVWVCATAPRLLGALAIGAACLLPTQADGAVTPRSPEVLEALAKAAAFLEKDRDNRPGLQALLGLTLLKAERPARDPKVQEALASVQGALERGLNNLDVYSVGLAIIFLVELDPQAHRKEIDVWLAHLLKIQQPGGGWGYPLRETGDTSMTQYGVLAMWEASEVGIPTPVDAWERVTNWLLRTQDPSGAWGYQGVDPGSFQLVSQLPIRHSMASAGLGALYICADHFAYRQRLELGGEESPTPLLKQVKVQKEPAKVRPRVATTKVNFAKVDEAIARGEKWQAANYNISPTEYTHYYLYAFERYQSFREVSTRKAFVPSHWYEDGVRYLLSKQAPEGGWAGATGVNSDTAFAMLFLLRSSQKSIERVRHLGPGTLVGGRGLPDEDGEVQVELGQVVTKRLAGPAEQLIAAMEDPRHPDYLRAVEGFEALVEGPEPPDLGRLSDRLRKLAATDAPEARIAALRGLARSRDLDHAPLLIAALADPDPQVFLAAEEALRFVARSFADSKVGAEVTDARRATALRKWKSWYRTIRPAATLED